MEINAFSISLILVVVVIVSFFFRVFHFILCFLISFFVVAFHLVLVVVIYSAMRMHERNNGSPDGEREREERNAVRDVNRAQHNEYPATTAAVAVETIEHKLD